jgi:hypothetical protein
VCERPADDTAAAVFVGVGGVSARDWPFRPRPDVAADAPCVGGVCNVDACCERFSAQCQLMAFDCGEGMRVREQHTCVEAPCQQSACCVDSLLAPVKAGDGVAWYYIVLPLLLLLLLACFYFMRRRLRGVDDLSYGLPTSHKRAYQPPKPAYERSPPSARRANGNGAHKSSGGDKKGTRAGRAATAAARLAAPRRPRVATERQQRQRRDAAKERNKKKKKLAVPRVGGAEFARAV